MSEKVKQNIWLAVKILIGLFIISPLIMSLLLSFQSNAEINNPPFNLFSSHPTLENYRYIITGNRFLGMLKNTLICIIITIPVDIFISSLTAFVFSHYNFKLKKFLFMVCLAAMMIPGETITITNFMTVQSMHLLDTYLGLCITGFANVGAVFMLRQHMLSLPSALWDAARVDGCSNLRYYFSVMLPLSKPIIVALVLNSFIGIYNSYFWPLIVTTKPEMQVLSIGVVQLGGDAVYTPGYVLAGGMLTSLIPILVYIFGIDGIVEGMTAGAVKS